MTKDSRRDAALLRRLALSRADLALAIGVSTTSVDQMVAEGTLPPARRWRSRKLWLVREVETALGELPVDGAAGRERARTGDEWLALLDEATASSKGRKS